MVARLAAATVGTALAFASAVAAQTPRAPIPGTGACLECHAGPAEKTYALSKHGVIARLDAGRARGAATARAPTCATCHPAEASRPVVPHHANPPAREQARGATADACRACHAPRYVAAQLDAAARALAIGEMKRREAHALVDTARHEADPATLGRIEVLYAALVSADLRSLRLGLGHQSPDDQWWLGQAALDGTLLRIKGALTEARRDTARATLPPR